MTTMLMAPGPVLQLPWSATQEDDQKFRKYILITLLLFVVVGVVVPLLPVPEIEREELEEIPPQLAKIIMEKKTLNFNSPRIVRDLMARDEGNLAALRGGTPATCRFQVSSYYPPIRLHARCAAYVVQ